MMDNLDGVLFYGDCLNVLRGHDLKGERYIKDESVDLIYLDPPFNSSRIYNIIFKEANGRPAASQIKGFRDTWTWNDDVMNEYEQLKAKGGKVVDALVGLEHLLGFSNMFAYLVMMAVRLIEMRKVLKTTGSIYLHCDQTAGHYIKIIMDSIFGVENFINEIIWCYRTGGVSRRHFSRKHDNILFYAKSDKYVFNCIEERIYYKKPFFTSKKDEMGRYYADVILVDYWNIPAVINVSKERVGYPTQKPEELLERIILASTNEGDLVLDPFCGCGTTVSVAQRLHRKWIGIDITAIAINLIKHRLSAYPDAKYIVIGEPVSLEDAIKLAKEDRYRFQLWALGLDKARPSSGIKKGRDAGIDGKRFFTVCGKTETILYSVKSGSVSVKDVRDLRGVIEREKAAIGVLISLEPITKDMYEEAARGGVYRPIGLSDVMYPRIQLYTVEELITRRKSVRWPSYLNNVEISPSVGDSR